MGKKILIISRIPPPIGGVSIHTFRLAENLKEKDWSVLVAEPTFANILKIGFYAVVSNVIHIHSLRFFSRTWFIWALFRLFGKNLILSLHSYREKSFFDKLALRIPKHIISVNNDIANRLKEKLGIKSHVISPFLLPTKKEQSFFKPLAKHEKEFFQTRDVISVNAWKVTWENGKDIYGLDLVIEAFSSVQKGNKKAGLCLCIPQLTIEGGEYLENLKSRFKIDNTTVLIIDRGVNFLDVLMLSSVFVRPTRTDGDALSVKEALLAGIPTIATKVVERPTGVILTDFDYECLARKINEAINYKNKSQFQANPMKMQTESRINMDKLFELYST